MLLAADFGDAPLPYPAASHEALGPTLGSLRDTEAASQPTANADGDGADDDGVTFGALRVGQLGATVTVNVQNAPSEARLDAWIDFNGDGNWGGAGEHVFANRSVAEGDNTLTFDVPTSSFAGTLYARFRVSTAGFSAIAGNAADGELEDYAIPLAAPPAGTGTFAPAQNSATLNLNGVYLPINMATADIDQDGDLDFLLAGPERESIAWYENHGGGFFGAHIVAAGITSSVTVSPADIDDDGDVDILAAQSNIDRVMWYENDGDQNFTLRIVTTTADGAYSATATDMDGDGDQDVLVASSNDNTVAWYENNGAESFSKRVVATTFTSPQHVRAADMDRDGDLDIVASSSGRVSWFENNGSQAFTTRNVYSGGGTGGGAPTLIDLDRDGDIDIVANVGSTISRFDNNNGDQFFTQSTISSGSSQSTTAADMDGDGDIDLLSNIGSIVNWHRNNGNQVFTRVTLGTLEATVSAVIPGDFDGDGFFDIVSFTQFTKLSFRQQVVASDYGDAPAPYLTTLAETGARHRAVGPRLGAGRDVDANGVHSAGAASDGPDDDGVAFAAVQVGESDATVTVNVQDAPAGARVDAWIDFNGDGNWGGAGEHIVAHVAVAQGDNVLSFDVPATAVSGVTYARIRLSTAGGLGPLGPAPDGEVEDYAVTISAPNLGSELFAAGQTITSGSPITTSLRSADLDGDGDVDIIATQAASAGLVWHENTGGSFVTHVIVANFGGDVVSLDVADLDSDGDLDIVAAIGNFRVDWYENNGAQNFTQHSQVAATATANTVFAVDVNGDGRLDIVTTYRDSGTQMGVWYENNGHQQFAARAFGQPTIGFVQVTPVDLDRDGSMDIITSGTAVEWFLGSSGQFNKVVIAQKATSEILAGDVDRDGDLDLVTMIGGNVTMLVNNGAGAFTESVVGVVLAGLPGTFVRSPLALADADGDGDLDILAATSGQAPIVFENLGTGGVFRRLVSADSLAGRAVAWADVDGDGRQDVVASLSDGSVRWYAGIGAAAPDFGDAPAPYPTALADNGVWHAAAGPRLGALRDAESAGQPTAGADGDGADDDGVVFGAMRAGDAAVDVTVNVQDAPAGARLSAWIDFNGDGSWGGAREEVIANASVVAGDNAFSISIPASIATGTVYARFRLSTSGGLRPTGVAADGEMEDYAVSILSPENATAEYPAFLSSFGRGQNTLHIVDMDRDGDLDAVTDAANSPPHLLWYENLGDGGFLEHPLWNATGGISDVMPIDLDRDGDMDFVAIESNRLAWYENNGEQSFRRRQIVSSIGSSSNACLDAADADGDGDVDLLVGNSGSLQWFINDGQQGFILQNMRPGESAVLAAEVEAVDLDGDGDMDVLAAYGGGTALTWFERDGAGGYISRQIAAGPTGEIMPVDLDRDGDMDIVARIDGDEVWFEQNGGAFVRHLIWNGSYALSAKDQLAVGDLDGDGDLDLVSVDMQRPRLMLNDGDENFSSTPIGPPVSQSAPAIENRSLEIADINGDGDLEVLVTTASGSGWYEALPLGDYDRNGRVEQADRDLWEQTNGQTVGTAGAGADGDCSGTIDEDDLAVWEAHQGDALIPRVIAANALGDNPTARERIDGDDLLAWQRTLGTVTSPGWWNDWDFSGVVDAGDLEVWRRQFGAGLIPNIAWINSVEAAAEPAIAANVVAADEGAELEAVGDGAPAGQGSAIGAEPQHAAVRDAVFAAGDCFSLFAASEQRPARRGRGVRSGGRPF